MMMTGRPLRTLLVVMGFSITVASAWAPSPRISPSLFPRPALSIDPCFSVILVPRRDPIANSLHSSTLSLPLGSFSPMILPATSFMVCTLFSQSPKSCSRLLLFLGPESSIMAVSHFDNVFQKSCVRFGCVRDWSSDAVSVCLVE